MGRVPFPPVNFSTLSHERLLRVGLAIGALAGVLLALAGLSDLAEGRPRDGGDQLLVLGPTDVVALIGAIAAVLVITTIVAPFPWARLVGIVVTTAVATTAGFEGIRARIAEDFVADERTTLLAGGILVVAAFWTAVAGIAVSLLAMRQIAQDRTEEPDEVLDEIPMRPDGRPLRSSLKASLGFTLGLIGVLAPVLSAVAVALSLGALGDIRAFKGRLGGRGMAIAGVVLGITGLSLLIAVLGVGALVLTPQA